MKEYELRMRAYQLQQIDKEADMHMQAWLNHQVTATKESGKKQVPVYRKFKDFYDYESRLNEVLAPHKSSKVSPQMRQAVQRVAKRREGGHEL